MNTMPQYRIAIVPKKVQYRDGTLTLETARDGDAWVWGAVNPNRKTVDLLRRDTLVAFSRDRYEGFAVKQGTTADKILSRLVRDGAAEVTIHRQVAVRLLRSTR